jgi:CAAX amino terminal protease family.
MSRITSIRRTVSDHPIWTFLAVTAVYSGLVLGGLYAAFGSDLPSLSPLPYAWGPLVAAGVTVWLLDESVRDWLGQLRNVRVGAHWYLAGVAVMILGGEFERIVAVVLGAEVTGLALPPGAYVGQFLVTLLLAGALEELGWRGFLQPRLQRRVGAVSAGVVVGLVWLVWHVPMIVAGLGDFAAFHEYALNIVAVSILLAWLYNNTEGGLLVVMITHATHNMPAFLGVSEIPVAFDLLSGDVVFHWACVLLIVSYTSVQTLRRAGTLPAVPGRLTEKSLRGTGSSD